MYRIGKIVGNLEREHNFVITYEKGIDKTGEYVYYAHVIDENGKPSHDEIVDKFELAHVVGCGMLDYSEHDAISECHLGVWNVPGQPRIHKEVMDQLIDVILKEEYQKIDNTIKRVVNFL